MLFATAMSQEYSKDKVLASMQLLHEPVESTVARTPSPAPETSLPPLETIDARKVLRVGFLPDALPYAFFNKDGGLVGFDIELAHRLAREMGVTLAFVPVDRQTMAAQLADGYCDLVMSGVVVTTDRAREILFSDSYLDETRRVRRAGRSTRAIRQLGRDSRSRPADDRRPGRALLRRQAARNAAARASRGARRTSSRCSIGPPSTSTRWRCRPSAARRGP